MNEQERYEKAKEKVENIRGFYGHLTAYLFVNAFIVIAVIANEGPNIGMLAPAFFWGIGLFFHWAQTFSFGPFGDEWEERKIREIMERDPGGRKSKDDLFE